MNKENTKYEQEVKELKHDLQRTAGLRTENQNLLLRSKELITKNEQLAAKI